MTGPQADYLRATLADVASLPEPLAQSAKVRDHGEAEWPRRLVEDAVRALIDTGRVVNVLLYSRYENGQLVESNPVSTYEGSSAADNLRHIGQGFDRLPKDTPAVVCWYPSER